MDVTINYGSPVDTDGTSTVLLEVNGSVVDSMYDLNGKETYNPLLVIDYQKDGQWSDIMGGDLVSVTVAMKGT